MKLWQICSGRYCLTLLVSALFVMVLGMALPTTAWASDGEEGPTGFLAGLDTLVNPDSAREVENDPVRDYEYEPVLREPETVDDGEEIGFLDGIQQFLSACYVTFANSTYSMFGVAGVRRILTEIVPIAVLLVFFWWGVRKSVHALMSAFRNGRLTLFGYDLNRNSYYYGTRAKDWR